MKIVRITGSGFVKQGAVTDGHPVEFRHWQEVVDEAESELQAAADQETEDAVVELGLEDPMSFQEATPMGPGVNRTAGSMVRHADPFGRKQAIVRESNWDQEVDNVKNHIASVLDNMGAKSWEKLLK